MFEHSVRVPRTYKLAGNILQKVKENGGNLKSLLYQEKNKHFRVQVVHALIFEALKHENQINDLIVKTKLLINENRLDAWLARILITELLWGKKKLPGESKPEQTIKKYHKQFEQILETVGSSKSVENVPVKEILKPRYIRLNTLRIDAADAVRHFQDDGWHLVRCTSKSYDDYLKQLENLAEDEFIPDYHVKVVFAFAPSTKFHNDQLYLNYDIFLQDKATALAAYILSPTPGSTVLDMCAAPGMKTTHLAAIMKNEGTIYAVEQNVARYQVLCEFVESSGATCVKPINGDAAEINKIACPNVDYVLLDPSCSGSGIVGSSRAEGNDAVFDLESGRVNKLAAFQAKLLRHALNEFSTAKRVVYSTCSLYCEENEGVIQDVVRNHKGTFRLVSAKEKLNNNWNNVGDPNFYDIGEKCLYARPSSDLTCGFFIAVFENKKDEIGNVAGDIKKLVKSIKVDKEKKSNEITTESIESNNDVILENETKVKKSKKRKYDLESNGESDIHNKSQKIEMCDSELNSETKHKKKKEIDIHSTDNMLVDQTVQAISETFIEEDNLSDAKKKKKSNKERNELEETVDLVNESPRKKSKKTHRHSTLLDNDISAIHFVEQDTEKINSQKKKHKKPSYSEVSEINECKDMTSNPKKKEKKKLEVVTENITIQETSKKNSMTSEHDTVAHDDQNNVEVVKKKKHKDKTIASEQNTLTLPDQSGVEAVKGKKHKNKTVASEQDTLTPDNQNSVEVVKEKKCKNKTLVSEQDTLTPDNQNSVEVVKEKKRKNKTIECLDLTLDDENSTEVVKEKKRKNKTVASEQDTLTLDNQKSVEVVKEKKRKNKTVECEQPVLTLESTIKAKNKTLVSEQDTLTPDNQNSVEVVKEKKRKNKTIECLDLTLDDENSTEVVKEKKRKNKTVASEQDTLTLDNQKSVEVVKEKKRKNKTVECEQPVLTLESTIKVIIEKKRKNKTISSEQDNLTLDNQNSSKVVKEKNHKNKTIECLDLTLDDENSTEVVKEKNRKNKTTEFIEVVKEKKRKNKTIASEKDTLTLSSLISVEIGKEKKNKKQLFSSEQDTLTPDGQSGVEVLKEKKRKNKRIASEQDILTLDDHNSVEVVKEKKCKNTTVASEQDLLTLDNQNSVEVIKDKKTKKKIASE